MQLKAAIEKAVRFCPRGKNAPATLQFIRFAPARGDNPARIYSTAGHLGVVVDVECELPDALIPVEALRKIVREAKTVRAIEQQKLGVFRLVIEAKKSGESMTYTVNGGDLETFPAHPVIPIRQRFDVEQNWDETLRVVHAAGKDPGKPDLQVVRFGTGYVLATDLYRAVCIDAVTRGQGYLPASVFKSWPKGTVESCWIDNYAFFRIDAELRFAALQAGSRHHDRLGRFFGGYAASSNAVCDTAQMRDAIKRAVDVSPWKVVSLDFGEYKGLTVRGFDKDRTEDAVAVFEAEISYQQHETQRQDILVNGPYLLQALKAVGTPSLRLRYDGPGDPLLIESGWMQTALWPSPWEEPDGC